MVLSPAGDVLEGAVEYSADLWDAATVEAWLRDYVQLLREGAEEFPADETDRPSAEEGARTGSTSATPAIS
ncbi:hypothetical protein ACWEQJ_14380 [Streptomyces cyaneofuscatus]